VRPLAIVDYGVGTLRSALVTSAPERIAAAPAVVLPGQGAFGTCMTRLRDAGLVEPILEVLRRGRPFLGICIGMQLLFEESEESPGIAGLGVLGGRVVRFPPHPERKVPHIGWNQLHVARRVPLLADVEEGAYVYFVHSYYAVPADPAVVTTTTTYGPEFASSVGRDHLFAGVFHPEKSQQVGLRVLANFVRLVG
jgi:glutamine amidotransferase